MCFNCDGYVQKFVGYEQKKKKFFYNCETVISFIFLMKLEFMFIKEKRDSSRHEIYCPVLCKKWGFNRNHLYFYFLLCHSFTWKLNETGGIVFRLFWHQKSNWLMVSWFKGHKIMKPPDSGGKKKWNWRHAAAPRPSVSFFFPPESGRFHNFSPLNHETTASFIFEPKNPKTKPPVSFSFTWNWAQKKKKVS